MNLEKLNDASRLLVSVELKPLQGTRFQPTGFPDIGAATYDGPDGTKMLLVESAQSMANRMEAICWNSSDNAFITPLTGLSYIAVNDGGGKPLTNSILEAHRLNSPYISGEKSKVFELMKKELPSPPNAKKFVEFLMKYDVNALLHGIFISKKEISGGRYRLPRALSSFVEAKNVNEAVSGGVKNDVVNPGKGDEGSTAKEGFGNVPYQRSEYTGQINAFFSLDLAQIRSYGLDKNAQALLVALALFKIRRVLNEGLRFRTACDLKAGAITVDAPEGFVLPTEKELSDELPGLIAKCKGSFAGSPALTETFVLGKGKSKKSGNDEEGTENAVEGEDESGVQEDDPEEEN